MTVRRLWGCLFLSAAAVAALLISDTRDSVAAGRHEATYSYGSHTRQTLDAYWNAAGEERDGRQPGLVILHGGYWHEDTGWATWSRTFADAGYAVFAVDYRLNHDAPWPAQRTDALSALGWIRDHAADFDLDVNRMVLLGSSSGARSRPAWRRTGPVCTVSTAWWGCPPWSPRTAPGGTATPPPRRTGSAGSATTP
ncbi:alpha/beta hydrolase [Streptomyces stelliscabiei]|uniref:alpha/beta hydrolase n=1 Tax=Streptomyces stelliscabiei TaxID=146820 RepID=UPI002FF1A8A8